jgi:hypothetical protein
MPISPHITFPGVGVRMHGDIIWLALIIRSLSFLPFVIGSVGAQVVETTPLENFPAPYAELPISPNDQLVAQYSDPIIESEWCPSPCPSSLWEIDIGLIPTTLLFDDDTGLAVRMNIDRDNPAGVGKGAQFWFFDQSLRTRDGPLDFSAQTFFFDFYKRLRIERRELALGGGFAAGHIDFDWRWLRYDNQFFGGGGSVFGEAFYPLFTMEKAEFGAIGRARIALLAGVWEDDGEFHVGRDSFTLIDEFAWGFEMRRRFGRERGKYWYVDIERELQNWGTLLDIPYTADIGIQGLAFNFGVAW